MKKKRRHRNVKLRTGATLPEVRGPAPDGKAWCPSCDKAVAVNTTGFLRDHGDCGRIWAGPPNHRMLVPMEVEVTYLEHPALTSSRAEAHYKSPKGRCRECGKPLPGERTLCGACGVRLDS